MTEIYKFKSEIVRFLVNSKLKNPDISCRMLSLEASEKFNIKLSKSAINNILKKEKLSSPVGRRSQHLFHPEGERNNGGYYILKAIDEFLHVSKTAAGVLLNTSVAAHKTFKKEMEDVMQVLIFYRIIYGVNIDFSMCYDNEEVWQIVGRRPSRAVYNRIIKILNSSQLFAEEVVREMKQRLNPVAGFRFRLRDESSFFIDGALNSIWPKPVSNNSFNTTYYNSSSYVNDIIKQERMISVFNVQDINIFSKDILNFITGFDAQDRNKQILQIELIGQEQNILATGAVTTPDRRFFFLGFWPWQLDMMSEFERKPAKQKLAWNDLGIEYFYQIEEIIVPQHLVNKEVRLTAVILKNTPLGAARIGILTNLPRDVIHKFLSYKELYHWYLPEDRYKDFMKKAKNTGSYAPGLIAVKLSNILQNNSLDNIFATLSEIILEQFQYGFCDETKAFDPQKLKDIFSRQKIMLKPGKEFIIHNLIINKELWNESEVKYACRRLNEAGIKDGQERLLWFRIQ